MSIGLKIEEQRILDNQRLVYYLVRKLGVTSTSSDYDDIVSVGTIGLIKASRTFDASKKISFATYASKCIQNEIFMYYRKNNKYAYDISLDSTIVENADGDAQKLRDKIEYSDFSISEQLITKELFIKLMSAVLNYLSPKERIIMLYRIGNTSQKEISKASNLSQSYISRIAHKALLKLQTVVNNNIHYKEVFFMNIMEDSYKITFASKDISNFNKIFASLLQNLTSVKTLPNFKVNCNNKRIIIQIPAHPESFSFIAQIIQEIDNFDIAFTSDKTILTKENNIPQIAESDGINKCNNTTK